MLSICYGDDFLNTPEKRFKQSQGKLPPFINYGGNFHLLQLQFG